MGVRRVGSVEERRSSASFEEFYASARPWAFRLAGLLAQDPGVGEEVTQEVFLAMYRRWDTIDQPDAYLRRGIVNGCHNWHRRRALGRSKLQLLIVEQHRDSSDVELADAIAALPYRQRAVIVLRFYADLSEVEIAHTLGCRPGTVKSLCSRALARLSKEVPR